MMGVRLIGAVLAVGLWLGCTVAAGAEPLDGVTFAGRAGTLYLPLREAGETLGMPVRWDAKTGTAYLNDQPVPAKSTERLPDGSLLIAVRDLTGWGVDVRWDAEREVAVLSRDNREAEVRAGEKRVVIDRSKQELRAWQGDRLVLQSRVSTGSAGRRTPAGTFAAGPYKARMHYSSLYNNAPMPWSVQITGNIFVHGFSSVPEYPASHGCIRMPTTGHNPARWFYEWIDRGTPVTIQGSWS